jgi:hypothetical protein
MSTNHKPIASSSLSTAELERMAAEFDREFVADTFGPPPVEVRTRFSRAKRKRGRPRLGIGTQAISVTIEKTLLRRVDALAKRRNTPRARLIACGLRALLRAEELGARRKRSGRRGSPAGTR